MNDKKERLLTSEVQTKFHGTTNIQFKNLEILNTFAKRMKRAYPELELEFILSGNETQKDMANQGMDSQMDNDKFDPKNQMKPIMKGKDGTKQ